MFNKDMSEYSNHAAKRMKLQPHTVDYSMVGAYYCPKDGLYMYGQRLNPQSNCSFCGKTIKFRGTK